MNLKNILLVRNSGNILPKATVIDNLFGMKLSGGGGPKPTYFWDFTGANPTVDKIQQATAITNNTTFDSAGMHCEAATSYFRTPNKIVQNARYVVELGTMGASGIDHHGDVAGFGYDTGSGVDGLVWLRGNYWAAYVGGWENLGIGSDADYFSDSVVELVLDATGTYQSHISIFKDGELIKKSSNTFNPFNNYFFIGSNGYSFKNMVVKSLKIYEPEV